MTRESGGWEIDAGFVAAFQVEWRAPAEKDELAAIEATLGVPLPDEVRAWYGAANGGVARAQGSELVLHSLAEVAEWFANAPLAKRGHFPFATNNDSNPFCVCCTGPLRGYVIQTPHDDEPRLMYRSAAGFFQAAAAQLRREQCYEPHDLSGDFEAAERTDDDVRIGRELVGQVRGGTELKKKAATIALLFAADLLSDAAEIRAIAELGDEYVSQHVVRRLQRLQQLGSPEADREVAAMHAIFDDFVEGCASQLRAAGYDVTVDTPYGRKALTVNPHDIGLNMEMFFAKRNSPDCAAYLLERVQALVAISKQESATKP